MVSVLTINMSNVYEKLRTDICNFDRRAQPKTGCGFGGGGGGGSGGASRDRFWLDEIVGKGNSL